MYGLNESQFRGVFERAKAIARHHWPAFLQLLEIRLDQHRVPARLCEIPPRRRASW